MCRCADADADADAYRCPSGADAKRSTFIGGRRHLWAREVAVIKTCTPDLSTYLPPLFSNHKSGMSCVVQVFGTYASVRHCPFWSVRCSSGPTPPSHFTPIAHLPNCSPGGRRRQQSPQHLQEGAANGPEDDYPFRRGELDDLVSYLRCRCGCGRIAAGADVRAGVG